MSYIDFIKRKGIYEHGDGFDAGELPTFLFDFQSSLVEWALNKGRAAIFADCGLGKTPMQLVWADKVSKKTGKPVLLLTPLAVGQQTIREAEKFGIEATKAADGKYDKPANIVVTNYEQLHKFKRSEFSGVVCDESSCIKDFKSQRKKLVTEFMKPLRYRLLCTATAAPNDYWELGTSSEALGLLGFRDMITTFFKLHQDKYEYHWSAYTKNKYRFRGHAEEPFWAWVCSWARAIRKPSDLGGSDDGFILPKLNQTEVIVNCEKSRDGMLFSFPARNLHEQRQERRNSIPERCEMAAELASQSSNPAVVWCELNDEGDELERLIDGAVQVKGSDSDEKKEEALIAFSTGELNRLVIKPKIGAWGLNWQHCNRSIHFPSHSYEQYYQAVRRFYRFGQKRRVDVTLIVNEGQYGILKSLERKASQAEKMFESIVTHMSDAMALVSKDVFPMNERIPAWL